jgi:hypothetical protein
VDDQLLLTIAVYRLGGRQVITREELDEARHLTLYRGEEEDSLVLAAGPAGSPLASQFRGDA